jgi:hypothetical protein
MQIVTQDDDAEGFVAEVRACVFGIIRLYHPTELFLIKTNTWFGPNWLRFSGKTLGLLGVWSGEKTKNLAVPPFVPYRVLWERRYAAPEYRQIPIRKIVHVGTPSDKARTRYVRDVAPSASLVWYSGASQKNGRGAIMAYLLLNGSYWPWYLGWKLEGDWKIVKSVGATIDEIAAIRKPEQSSIPS